MSVTVAKEAGFCFGVTRATDYTEKLIAVGDAKIYTLGTLIHNGIYNSKLKNLGVGVCEISDAERIACDSDKIGKTVVIIRTHGIPKNDDELLKKLSREHANFDVCDMTCPFVKRIHKIADENTKNGAELFVIGAPDHPEVLSIVSYAHSGARVFSSDDELEQYVSQNVDTEKNVVLVSQTTQKISLWKKCQKIIEKVYTNPIIFDTICNVTANRQSETVSLAKASDVMIVIGGKDSSNTKKLYALSVENCPQAFMIEQASDLENQTFARNLKIGITAGASTPRSIIEEVYKSMSAETMENFEEMLEKSLKTLNTGDTVVGTVMSVSQNEIRLDLGAKATGVITLDQITDDPMAKLTEMYKVGDQVEGFVIKVSDIDGIATLSKKRVDSDKNWKFIVEANEKGETLEGKVVEAVKGGVLISLMGVRVFIPGRLSGLPKDADLSSLVGTTQKVKIVEVNDQRHHAYASIRAVAGEIKKAKEDEFWASAEVGKHYMGTVKNLMTYGAFVDLGGVDGMVHNSELSWKHIKHSSDVLKTGDVIDVYIKELDREKGRISLGYKTDEMNSWYVFKQKYNVGDVATVKIVSMMPFGAFAEIVPGTDGLIHISQISKTRISKPADVLSIGQEVEAKITDIDDEKQKVSLSIRALIEDAEAAAADAVDPNAPDEIVASSDGETVTE